MPSIQGNHYGRAAIIQVAIYDAARYDEHKQSKQRIFRRAQPFRTLIDTGATFTMISPRVVSAMELRPFNRRRIGSVQGITSRRGYLFHVAFVMSPSQGRVEEDGGAATSPVVMRTLVCPKVINGAELDEDTTFDVLLGMDVISTGDLTFKRDGTFSFDF